MTQPDAHQSLALFRDSLIVDFVPLPASSQRLYVRWRDKAQGSRAALVADRVEQPEGHDDPNGGFAAGANAEHFSSSLKRAAALPA